MSSKIYGEHTSMCEVSGITEKGIWIYVSGKESFIPFAEYPMLRSVPIEKIFNVRYTPPEHLYWEEEDIDIELSAIQNSEDYPLLFR